LGWVGGREQVWARGGTRRENDGETILSPTRGMGRRGVEGREWEKGCG